MSTEETTLLGENTSEETGVDNAVETIEETGSLFDKFEKSFVILFGFIYFN